MFVLKSNGTLYQIDALESSAPSVQKFNTQHLTSAADTEGLTWDKTHHRLLIACKAATNRAEERENFTAFDLTTQQFSDTPLFRIQAQAVYDFCTPIPYSKNGINLFNFLSRMPFVLRPPA
ncbi:MAG: hypothetical protein HC912_05345 [Saprospiraceae bacterium]|nr:hypothetical protein [Saprospiraceae bacterium]